MEGPTFRKWLAKQGCHFKQHVHHQRGEGPVTVTVHREGRQTEIALAGARKHLDPREVRRACEELGLDWSQLPGPRSRV